MIRFKARIRKVLSFICFSVQIQNPIETAEDVVDKAEDEENVEDVQEDEPQVITNEEPENEAQPSSDETQDDKPEEVDNVVAEDNVDPVEEFTQVDEENQEQINEAKDNVDEEKPSEENQENSDEVKTVEENNNEELDNDKENNVEVEENPEPLNEELVEASEMDTSSPKTPFSDAPTVVNDPNYQSDNEEGSDVPVNPMDQIEEFPLSSNDEFVDQTEDELVALGNTTTEEDESNLPENLGDEVSRQISSTNEANMENVLDENLGDEVPQDETKEQELLASDDAQAKQISESAVITGMVHGSPDEGRLQSAIVDRRVDDDDDNEEVVDDAVSICQHICPVLAFCVLCY